MAELLDAAFGREGYAGGSQNYGSSASHAHYLRTQGAVGDAQASYLKFQLAPDHVAALAAGVDATLVLEQFDIEKGVGESGSITAHAMPSNWDSTTVTFVNAPAPVGELGSAKGADRPGQVLRVEVPLRADLLASALSTPSAATSTRVVSICVTSSGSGAILFRSGKSDEGETPSLVFPPDAEEEEDDEAWPSWAEAALFMEAFGREGYAGGTATYGAERYLDSHRQMLRVNGEEGDCEHSYLTFQLSAEQLTSLAAGADARLTLECFETKATHPGDVDVWACAADWDAETVTFATEPPHIEGVGQLGKGALVVCGTMPEMCAIALDGAKLLVAADRDSGIVSLQLSSRNLLGSTMFSSSLRPDGKAPQLSVLDQAIMARAADAAGDGPGSLWKLRGVPGVRLGGRGAAGGNRGASRGGKGGSKPGGSRGSARGGKRGKRGGARGAAAAAARASDREGAPNSRKEGAQGSKKKNSRKNGGRARRQGGGKGGSSAAKKIEVHVVVRR